MPCVPAVPGGNKSLSTRDISRRAQLSDNHLFIRKCIRWTVALL